MQQLPRDSKLFASDTIDSRISIHHIPDDWISYRTEMYSDLMHSSGIDFYLNERNISHFGMMSVFEYMSISFRRLSLFVIDKYFCSSCFFIKSFGKRCFYSFFFGEFSMYYRKIGFIGFSFSNLFIEVLKCWIGFCCDDNTARIPIEPKAKRGFECGVVV